MKKKVFNLNGNGSSFGYSQQINQTGYNIADSWSEQDGSKVYCLAYDGTDRFILEFTRDINTGIYKLTQAVLTPTTSFSSSDGNGIAGVGDYIYVFFDGGANTACVRLLKSNLATQTAMTMPAIVAPGSTTWVAWADSTFIYLGASSTGLTYKLSISGTTLTTVTTGTIDGSILNGTQSGSFFDGSSAYIVNNEGSQTYKLLNILGTLVSGPTDTQVGVLGNGTNGSFIAPIDTNAIFVGSSSSVTRYSGTSNTLFRFLMITPISKP